MTRQGGDVNTKTEREILAAHADQLNAGLRGADAYPAMTAEQQRTLTPLLQLAELLAELLIIVEPSPGFVQKLGQELALMAAQSQLSLFDRYRRGILVAAATLGSTLSVVGLVLFYRFRQRDTPPSTSMS
jgi:hypothetical protein